MALLHPAIWSQYGHAWVCGVLADCLDAGMILIAPGSDWRGPIAAADFVLGDYGSVPTFAAGIGTPVLKLPHGPQPLLEGTPAASLSAEAPGWDPERPLEPQLEAAARAQRQGLGLHIADQLTSVPGKAAQNLQDVMYRLLGLTAPAPVSHQKQHVPYPRLVNWPRDVRPPRR
ncbi:hypothetical protein [Amycolatopsis sp. cmx-4-61]|uniref:hypothetical protein n=1 Tax=Amycolatopsis sp. cmx-4-61 TaxID=2790937 RepID=UPI00397AC787